LLDYSQKTWKDHKFLNSSKLVAFFVYLTFALVLPNLKIKYLQDVHEEPIELVVVVLVADSSDKPITAETELEDPTDNAVAVSESDGDAHSQEARFWNWFYRSFADISNW
jgi:hypothetical protein